MALEITTAVAIGVAVSAAAAVAGAVVAGVSAENAAQSASDAAKAEGELRRADANSSARQLRKQRARDLALQQVLFGKSGVIPSEGTSLEVLAENAGEFELEASAIERFGHNSGVLKKTQASSFSRQGKFSAAGHGIGGVGRAASITGTGIAANQ